MASLISASWRKTPPHCPGPLAKDSPGLAVWQPPQNAGATNAGATNEAGRHCLYYRYRTCFAIMYTMLLARRKWHRCLFAKLRDVWHERGWPFEQSGRWYGQKVCFLKTTKQYVLCIMQSLRFLSFRYFQADFHFFTERYLTLPFFQSVSIICNHLSIYKKKARRREKKIKLSKFTTYSFSLFTYKTVQYISISNEQK